VRWIAIAMLAWSCTTTRVLDRLPMERQLALANEEVRGRVADVQVAGETRRATGVMLGAEETAWIDAASQETRRVPTAALQSVSYRSRATGALEGLGIGLVVGALTGAVIGLASGDDQCNPNQWCLLRFSAVQKEVGAGIALGALGMISGVIIGAIVGHRDKIIFGQPPITPARGLDAVP
jgi:hypothetical protein